MNKEGLGLPVLESPLYLNSVFQGFPERLLPRRSFELLVRFCLDLDALGRLDPSTDDPLIDEQTLFAMLREFVGEDSAQRLVDKLKELPDSAFRLVSQVIPPPREVSWFELAKNIVIFDTTPTATFTELDLSVSPETQKIVMSVQKRFPSMEPELLEPETLPPRIKNLIENEDDLSVVLRTLIRQLGWWAALVAILLVPAATLTTSENFSTEDQTLSRNAWPLAMYFLASAVGGWTLTVVGSCILAPTD